jgi:NAD(P)H dehydrogenase (quinone)
MRTCFNLKSKGSPVLYFIGKGWFYNAIRFIKSFHSSLQSIIINLDKSIMGGILMNIGIIVHSHTGHTYNAALKLQEQLIKEGHPATIEKVTVAGEAHPGSKNIQLATKPEVKEYDGLVLAAPVWAFSLSEVLVTFLNGIPSLKDKKIAAFVTMSFPWAWMGGNRAIRQIKKLCAAKGGTVIATAIIGKSGNDPQKLQKMIEDINGVFLAGMELSQK